MFSFYTGNEQFKNARDMNLLVNDKILEQKVQRCCDDVNKTGHLVANEPSLGLYRIQQHIRKAMPKLVACESTTKVSDNQLKGLVFDTSGSTNVIQEMKKSSEIFSNIEKLLARATTAAAITNMK
ncbi:BLOC-1-related complex subunit 8-like [Ciona intestinalis]